MKDTSTPCPPYSGTTNPNHLSGLLEKQLTAESGTSFEQVYNASKFTQLLGAHYWRRQLKGQCDVVAVSPGWHGDLLLQDHSLQSTGLIPGTAIGRHTDFKLSMDMPDAKGFEDGKILCFGRDNDPTDIPQVASRYSQRSPEQTSQMIQIASS